MRTGNMKETAVPGRVLELDCTNDGTLVAVAMATMGAAPPVRILRMPQGEVAADFGDASAAQGVAFVDGGRALMAILEYDDGFRLVRANVDGSGLEELASYPGPRLCHALRRDATGTHVAVCGTFVEVRHTPSGQVLGTAEGAFPDQRAYAVLAADGSRVWTSGIAENALVEHETDGLAELGRLAAPAPEGGPLAISHDAELLVANGPGVLGVFVYDLETRERLLSRRFSETTYTALYQFTSDSGTLARAVGDRLAFTWPRTGASATGPVFTHDRPAAFVAARAAPLLVIGWPDRAVASLEVLQDDET